jgi:SAM-dependent methyltransferase
VIYLIKYISKLFFVKVTMYKQIRSKANEEYRFLKISKIIQSFSPESGEKKVLLDIGAGMSPFKQTALNSSWIYTSQDFGKYVPEIKKFPGLQSESWPYPAHDYLCDILDIPGESVTDLILCTEVLEHIPNPIAALKKMKELCKPGGMIIITVPFASLMHQAPYWFQSGLSPYWFQYWSEEIGIEIKELTVYGDYIDVMIQEAHRFTRISFPGKRIIIEGIFKFMRKIAKKGVLESLGHGVIFVGRVPK